MVFHELIPETRFSHTTSFSSHEITICPSRLSSSFPFPPSSFISVFKSLQLSHPLPPPFTLPYLDISLDCAIYMIGLMSVLHGWINVYLS